MYNDSVNYYTIKTRKNLTTYGEELSDYRNGVFNTI